MAATTLKQFIILTALQNPEHRYFLSLHEELELNDLNPRQGSVAVDSAFPYIFTLSVAVVVAFQPDCCSLLFHLHKIASIFYPSSLKVSISIQALQFDCRLSALLSNYQADETRV